MTMLMIKWETFMLRWGKLSVNLLAASVLITATLLIWFLFFAGPSERSAFAAAEDVVKERVELPSYAEFSELSRDNVLTRVYESEDNTFLVQGHVAYDLPDDNWSMIRGAYFVTLQYIDGDWHVLEFDYTQ